MTGQEILKITLDLLYEETNEYDIYAVSILNMMIAELFETENQIRWATGKSPLEETPYLTELKEEVPYDERLTRGAMPFGLASYIILDDNDMGRVGYFRQLYVNAVNSAAKILPEGVRDVYE